MCSDALRLNMIILVMNDRSFRFVTKMEFMVVGNVDMNMRVV